MSDVELGKLTASQIAGRVRNKSISAMEVTEAAIRRMESMDDKVNAFCTQAPDLARKMAAKVDSAIASGRDPGPLAGVPIGIKDLIATKELKTVCGSKAYENFTPEEDDVVVERLRDAGAIFLGKTNVPEFGYSGVGHNPVFETTRNPWNTDLTPGGSSAGSGAAVAAGMCPLAVASDGGGSIRIPAAHCGLVGIKASMGRVPLYPGCRDERYPGISSWESLEHIGPVSRTVEDSALMLSVMAGPDARDRHTIPTVDVDWMDLSVDKMRGKRIALSLDFGYLAVDPEVRALVTSAAKVFERDLKCHVEEVTPDWENPYDDFWGIVALETDLVGMREMVDKHRHEMTPHLVDFISREWRAEDLTNANMARKRFNNRMWRLMQDYDFLVTPTLTTLPFPVHMQGPEKIDGKIVHPFQWLSFTLPINLTGQPAASLPAGWTASGLPVGLQIAGRHLADGDVLKASAAFEQAAPWAEKWPAISS